MHFLAHIHTKDTNFIFGTPHTQYRYTKTNGHIQTHMDRDVAPLSHFALFVTCIYAKDTNFIFDMPQIYTCTDTQTHAHTSADTSTYRYRHMHTDKHKHMYRHTQTHMHIFLHTQTHIHICQVNSACSFYI